MIAFFMLLLFILICDIKVIGDFMENKYYYTYKEILFGLRHEYLKVQQELEKLKPYTHVNEFLEKKLLDFYFELSQCSFEKNPEVYCHFIPKQSYLKKKMNKIRAHLTGNFPIWCSKVLSDNNNRYYMEQQHFPIQVCDYEYCEEFDEILQKILNSDFAHSIYSKCDTNFLGKSYHLEIKPSNINLFGTINVMDLDSSCDYILCYDNIYISHHSKNLSQDFINETLNVQFSKQMIPSYHQNIIDDSNVSAKKIRIADDVSNLTMVDFSIEEDEKEIVLRKSDKRKQRAFY